MDCEILRDKDLLLPLTREWEKEVNWDLGFNPTPEFLAEELDKLIDEPNSDIIVLKDKEIVGLLALTIQKYPISNEIVASERAWFVKKSNRGIGSIRLIREAEKWAREKGCSHFLMYASNLASDMHDKVCHLYKRLGMRLFETSYIKEI
jgi:GNAT superfamily N-acetyltransferase